MQEIQSRSRSIRALAALSIACLMWGLSFPLMQFAMQSFNRAVALVGEHPNDLAMRTMFNSLRFFAAAVAYLFFLRDWRGFKAADVRGGFAVGAFFTIGLTLQIVGLRYCLPSVSGVLTSIVVIFTPFALSIIFRKRISLMVWLCSLIALVGVGILSQPNPDAVAANTLAESPPFPFLGELLTIAGAVAFTAQLIALDRFGRGADGKRLTLVMFASAFSISALASLALGGSQLCQPDIARLLLHDSTFVWSFAAMVVFSSVAAFHLMNVFQPRISATAAAIIYCLEPVFATTWSMVFGTERLTWITCVGGSVVILAVLLVSVRRSETEGKA